MPQQQNVKLDPRVEPMFKGRPLHERFIAVAMCALMATVDRGGELLDAVLAEIKGADVDWTEIVGGKQLHHYNGKTRAQLEKEGVADKTIEQVAKALERRGMSMVDGGSQHAADQAAKAAAAAAAEDAKKKPKGGEKPTPTPTPTAPPATTGEPQPELFAGKPLEFYNGLTRDQILAVEGINPQTADKILAKLAEGTKPAETK